MVLNQDIDTTQDDHNVLQVDNGLLTHNELVV